MAVKIATLDNVTIALGGQRVPLATSGLAATSIILQAEYTNVGRISIGDETVTTSNGIEIGPGDTFSLTIESIDKVGELYLKDVYVVSNTAGDSVRVMAYKRKV